MPGLLIPAFHRYPKEGELIGRMIAGYGELEFELAFVVGEIIESMDVAFKVMFRARGETQRIDLADALARSRLQPGRYRTHYEQTISAMRHCLKIRNQFAHCQWHDSIGDGLTFVNLEEIAAYDLDIDMSDLTQHSIPLELLQEQESYFVHVRFRLGYLNYELKKLRGELSRHSFDTPKTIPMPKRYN